MNDRQIIITALAGTSAAKDTNAFNVLGIAFEFLCAEADELVDCFEATAHNSGYSAAAAHAARCHALSRFVDKHIDAQFVEPLPADDANAQQNGEQTEGSAES